MARGIHTKRYAIQRRFTVWVEREIEAISMREAMETLSNSTFDDFLKTIPESAVIDHEAMAGDAVMEKF